MKFMKFSIVATILMLSVMSVSAGISADGNVIAASSDCLTVTVTYDITTVSGFDMSLRADASGDMTNFDVPDVTGTQTVTFAITPQATGTMIDVTLRADVHEVTGIFINCVIETEEVEANPRLIDDGRLEPFASDMVIYPFLDGIRVYNPDGELQLFISFDTIDMLAVPSDGTRLLGETNDGYVQIYRLSDGSYQVLVGPDSEGKVHIAIWNGLGFAENLITTTFSF